MMHPGMCLDVYSSTARWSVCVLEYLDLDVVYVSEKSMSSSCDDRYDAL